MNIPRLSIHRPIGTVALFLSFILFGLIAALQMDMDLFPRIEYPAITIITQLENKSPREIRNLLTVPMEEILSSTPGLRNMQSVSRYGESRITLYFEWGVKMDRTYMETREKLDYAKSILPQGSTRPVALQFDPNAEPVLILGVDLKDQRIAGREISFLRKNLLPVFERLDGVAYVQIVGGSQAEVLVDVDLDKLYANSLSIDDIVKALQENNLEYPAGYIEENEQEFSVRIVSRFADPVQMQRLVIGRNESGIPIYLENVATILKAQAEKTVEFRLNGKEAVALRFFKEGDANIVKTSRVIFKALPDIRKKFISDIDLILIEDNSRDISSSISNILWSAFIGMLLALAVLYYFLRDFNASMIAGAAIPLSILLTLFFMQVLGISLNLISLSGLSIGIGIMVDANIVVMENIKRYHYLDDDFALTRAVEEVQAPIVSSILTNIAVFLPIVFVPGIASSIFKELALVVTFSLCSSLLTSISLTPALFRLRLRSINKQALVPAAPLNLDKIKNRYGIWLEGILNHEKIFLGSLLVLFCLSLASFFILKQEILPDLSQSAVNVKIRFPFNFTLQKNREYISLLENSLQNYKGIEVYYSILGNSDVLDTGTGGRMTYIAEMTVITPQNKQPLIQDLRDVLSEKLSLAQSSVKSGDTAFTRLFPAGSQIYIQGTPIEYLEQIAWNITNQLLALGITNHSLSLERQEVLAVYFDRAGLNQSGLSTRYIADIAHTSLQGRIATSLYTGQEETPIRVQLDRTLLSNRDNLFKILVRNPQNNTFSLAALIKLSNETKISEISRRNQQELLSITFSAPAKTLAQLQRNIGQLAVEQNISFSYSWDSEETRRSVRSLILAMALSFVVIFVIIAFQFESVVKPLIIMLSIPLVFMGIFPVFLLTGTSINVISLVGTILLGGIVVNNAIVLVDFYEQKKHMAYNRLTLTQLIMEGSLTRLRPILMTSLTTIVSLLPLILFPGQGMEFQRVLAITVISGFIFSTVVTMFFIPTVYYIWARRAYP